MVERNNHHPEPQNNPSDEQVTAPGAELQGNEPAGSQEGAGKETQQVAVVPIEEYEAMQKSLEEVENRAREYFDGWQRERADFANYKRRIERDQATLSQTIAAEVIKKYLVVLDDLDRAMKMRPTEGEAAAWADGIELIYRKLQNILEAEGIKRIPAENEEFDPMRHEAISYEESPDHQSGQIIGVVQEGYMLGDRVLRPARVRVAR
ncbi:MAG TPA: nucleotide exchange factor GrpE [Anaerolinea thermolimosa]|uniref:Protein GrpE n=1 Tax=Anaerolinea thermolimosa TaxID=229919 RepID=A0A3D1JEI1_9CHLR|nr:nucleotide exchange factor GrpE [Anaerolinea thermolimosa]GAP05544.1 molecular chaperone GrpE [Anaerolinea thermolimosa]HCE17001.1 nucleotide exchange factor GrpE [Anaerolinea thermolimosa]